MLSNGFVLTIVAVTLLTAWDVFSNWAVDALGANPALYSSFSLFIAAFVLLVIAGPGRLGFETLKSTSTWLYAFFQIFMGVFETYSYTVVTATEFQIITRIQVLLSILIAFMILGRKPSKHDMIGCLIIISGVWVSVATLSAEIRGLAIVFIGLSSLFFVLRSIVAETHKESNMTSGVKDECRVAGFILLITSFVFIAFYAIIGYVSDITPISGLAGAPSIEDFLNGNALLAAFICGAFLISTAKYFYFVAIKLVKTENFALVGSFNIVVAFLLEGLLSRVIPSMNVSTLDQYDVLSAVIALSGVVYMYVMRKRT